MNFDQERFLAHLKQASTEELLRRVTVERPGMEPQLLPFIEAELFNRGVSQDTIERYAEENEEILRDEAGLPFRCSLCANPAVTVGWGWHRLWGLVPIFPRRFRYCKRHLPNEPEA